MAKARVKQAEEILDEYFPVLDHGFVALVDYMGDDRAIIDAARTSYGAGTKRVQEDRALTRYLYRNRHTTPLEMVELKFHCKMPIVVARQWIRHRTANVNEYSGRYSLMPMQFYTPKREQVTTQTKGNRQGRTNNMLLGEHYEDFCAELEKMRQAGQLFYEAALRRDVAREVARLELPLSMYTEWYWKIDLHNLLHFLGLRCHEHAQWEIREYAAMMAGMVKRVAPNAFEAWLDYHPNMGGVLLSRQELDILRTLLTSSYTSGALCTRAGAVGESHIAKEMSSRETAAFLKLFEKDDRSVPSFDLDLSAAKPASYFAEETEKYVPKITR